MTETEYLQLAADFPPVTRDQWRALVDGVLGKGLADPTPETLARRFERQLVSHTYDGITVEPLYDGSEGAPDPGLPGQAPWVRGRTALAGAAGGWDVCQRVEVGRDVAAANRAALDELENGATSLWLGTAGAGPVDADLLQRVLDGVYLHLIPVRLDGGDRPIEAANALLELWAREGVVPDPAGPQGCLGLDPLRTRVAGAGDGEGATVLGDAAELAATCAESLPRVRTFAVDGVVYHEAGASDAEELGCALATTVSYLRALTDAGLATPAAWDQLEVRLAAGADQFATIAKLRAARRLWGRVAEVVGVSASGPPPLHAVTSPAMFSAYDPWVNLLRTTVACFAAGVGGADAVTVLPYDSVAVGPASSDRGRRLARNIQSLLLEESGLARIIDPAGGSWYVEALTAEVAARAWAWFGEIEAAGGMAAALASGKVAERLAATWAARAGRLATGADPLCGVSEFPDIDEAPPARPVTAAGTRPGGLPIRRYPEIFELLRARTDRHVAAGKQRPTVYLATLGTPAAFTARATFAKNLFEVVGIRAVTGDPEGFAASGARLACICSSDKVYAEQAASAAAALKDAGATWLYLAGRPGDHQAEWEGAGVDEFVYQGADRVDVLGRALEQAGVNQ